MSYLETAQRLCTFDSNTSIKNKASWHRKCDSGAANKTNQGRAEKRFEKQNQYFLSDTTASCSNFTRQCADVYNKSNCFFLSPQKQRHIHSLSCTVFNLQSIFRKMLSCRQMNGSNCVLIMESAQMT